MGWLYRYEAKSIQSWILATDRLIELQGGSTLVEQLQVIASDAIHRAGGQLRYAAAGSATATFDDLRSLGEFVRWWPMYVSRHAPGIELVQAWSDRGLAELRERLGTERNRPRPDIPEAGPWVARAGRSGLPAIGRDADGGMLDRGTQARARAGEGRDLLGEWMSEDLEVRLPDAPPGVRFRRALQKYPEDEGIAVVHADGNQLGKAIHGMDTEQLERFSKALSQASREAARRTLAGLVAFERNQDRPTYDSNGALVINGRPIVAGGDDFTFLVRGRAGLAVAEIWLRAFEEESVTARIKPLTACAGVVLVRRGFPFHQAHEIAERLCRSAKEQHRRLSAQGSLLRFERVTTSLHDSDDLERAWTLEQTVQLANLVDLAERIGARGNLLQWMAETDSDRANERWARLREVADPTVWNRLEQVLESFPTEDRRSAIRAALQWGRIHPGLSPYRLWRNQ